MRSIILAAAAGSFIAAPLLADPQGSFGAARTASVQLAQYNDQRDQAERDRIARDQYQRDHPGDQGDRRDGDQRARDSQSPYGQQGYRPEGDRRDGDQRARDADQRARDQNYRQDGDRRDGFNGDRRDNNGDRRDNNGDRRDANDGRRDGEYAAGTYYPEKDYRAGRNYRPRYLAQNEQVYRGRDNRYYCKRSDGTTGLIIGGLGGGVLGNIIAPGGSKTLGTVLGGGLGAVLGNVIGNDSNRTRVQCR